MIGRASNLSSQSQENLSLGISSPSNNSSDNKRLEDDHDSKHAFGEELTEDLINKLTFEEQ